MSSVYDEPPRKKRSTASAGPEKVKQVRVRGVRARLIVEEDSGEERSERGGKSGMLPSALSISSSPSMA